MADREPLPWLYPYREDPQHTPLDQPVLRPFVPVSLGDEFVITRESGPSLKDIRERAGAREATDEEFAAFEAEHGPFLLPDGEG